ncbi:hypothetical protein LV84_04175 [Algoriphagus ratkowskyi]|uniref:Mannosyltransferase PIG-V n=1 Tax=Algoriphagus ratkowskyi TaxID=57028 RepID=A0A2W7QMU5_9BACT|nr:hypothetical protein [Algoriphagus ratkowskyi]PZX49783.1 hypothetical protein LV84_04175 [Algoriphagus ratkowskyi]TXD75497.1 hypothetical protein ESW18_20430 [Algoriphagus ratkowskyi]
MKEFFIFRQRSIFNLIIVSIFGITNYFLIRYIPSIDIKDHNLFLIDYLEAGLFPIPPGYYFLVYILDFIFHFKYPFVVSSFLVLTFFLWWKYHLVYNWLEKDLAFNSITLFFLAASFLFLSPVFIPVIDGDFWYLGKFAQTIWHNSTLIASFPFCILLFKRSFNWFESRSNKDYFQLFVYGLAILLIKPSFLFCYVPALPVYVFLREKGISALVWKSLGLSVLLFFLILVEKFLIFSWDPMIQELYSAGEVSEVVINPFLVWLHFSDQPVFDFVSSIPMIMMFLILWGKRAFDSSYFYFSLISLFFALMIYAVFAESGFRELHGNFYWQIPIALFLTHLSILITLAKEYVNKDRRASSRVIVMILIYLVQVSFGIAYWLRIFTGLTLS